MSTPVAESTGYGRNREMSVLGYAAAIGIAILLSPLLPVFLVGWVLWRLFGSRYQRVKPLSWGRRSASGG